MNRPDEESGWISAEGSLWDQIERRAAATPDAVLATDELGRALTCGAYRDHCRALAVELLGEGVRPGDTVAWQMPTWLETIVLTGALDALRVVQAPILPQLREREVAFITDQVHAAWYVHPGAWNRFDYGELAARLQAEGGTRLATVTISRPHLPTMSDPIAADDLSIADNRTEHWYFYTSGTTGVPKGVRHGHDSVVAATMSMCRRMRVRADDCSVVAFPLTHIGGINWLMAALVSGCSLLVIESFAAPGTMDVIARHPVTFAGVTTAFHLAYLAEQRRRGTDHPLLPSVRAYPGGAAPKPRTLQQDLIDTIGGVGIVAGFGLTEFPMITMSSVDDPLEKLAATEGRPSPGVDVVIVGKDGHRCALVEDGEICARGPNVMLGYVDRSLDAAVFDADGYFHTGDLGHLDADGYLAVTGRLKDVIVRKGENISAREVEELVFGHPAVADVAVVGLPDDERGEIVCAVITPVEGASLTAGEIVTYLRGLAVMAQKLPERIVFVEDLPRNGAGKVVKSELRERILAGAAGGWRVSP